MHRGWGLRVRLGLSWGPGISYSKCIFTGRIQLGVLSTDSGDRDAGSGWAPETQCGLLSSFDPHFAHR